MGFQGWADEYHRNKARDASLRLAEKQRAYEKPVPISVILGSVAEFPTNHPAD
jgi:hypothetical protein